MTSQSNQKTSRARNRSWKKKDVASKALENTEIASIVTQALNTSTVPQPNDVDEIATTLAAWATMYLGDHDGMKLIEYSGRPAIGLVNKYNEVLFIMNMALDHNIREYDPPVKIDFRRVRGEITKIRNRGF